MPTLTEAVRVLYDAFAEENHGGYYIERARADNVAEMLNVIAQYLNDDKRWQVTSGVSRIELDTVFYLVQS